MSVHGLQFPFALLNDGATVRAASGENVEFPDDGGLFSASQSLVSTEQQCVLDARVLNRGTPTWYSDTSERVSSMLGGQLTETVVPISPRVSTTLGGIPCDTTGRVHDIIGLSKTTAPKHAQTYDNMYAKILKIVEQYKTDVENN